MKLWMFNYTNEVGIFFLKRKMNVQNGVCKFNAIPSGGTDMVILVGSTGAFYWLELKVLSLNEE